MGNLNVTKEGVKVEIGQVWRDLDKRMGNRHVRVVAFVEAGRVQVHRCLPNGRIIGETRTRLLVRRMHKTSTGWALVKDVA